MTSIHSLIHGVLGRWLAEPVVHAAHFSGNLEYNLSFLLNICQYIFIRVALFGRETCPLSMYPSIHCISYTGKQKKGYKVICLLFFHIVNIMYIVLEQICQIWTKFSEAKIRQVSLNGFARLALYLNFWVLWKPNNGCGRERMF